jgi:hypothetical protein
MRSILVLGLLVGMMCEQTASANNSQNFSELKKSLVSIGASQISRHFTPISGWVGWYEYSGTPLLSQGRASDNRLEICALEQWRLAPGTSEHYAFVFGAQTLDNQDHGYDYDYGVDRRIGAGFDFMQAVVKIKSQGVRYKIGQTWHSAPLNLVKKEDHAVTGPKSRRGLIGDIGFVDASGWYKKDFMFANDQYHDEWTYKIPTRLRIDLGPTKKRCANIPVNVQNARDVFDSYQFFVDYEIQMYPNVPSSIIQRGTLILTHARDWYLW